ncbi:hypothetical protein GQ54DRAFT_51783 [Martensiomyces pterosporus]|nr:hypothetical protein GQ54DRAFT_51783 [Martensiomyces pterosporus]
MCKGMIVVNCSAAWRGVNLSILLFAASFARVQFWRLAWFCAWERAGLFLLLLAALFVFLADRWVLGMIRGLIYCSVIAD